jgi:hypothetical protein
VDRRNQHPPSCYRSRLLYIGSIGRIGAVDSPERYPNRGLALLRISTPATRRAGFHHIATNAVASVNRSGAQLAYSMQIRRGFNPRIQRIDDRVSKRKRTERKRRVLI